MNKQHFISTFLLVMAVFYAGPATAAELIREYKGGHAMQTGEFDVEGPWILDWRVSGDYARDMAVDISLFEAKTNMHMGNVLKTKSVGNGVRLFNEDGRFYFRVDSTLANWTLRVKQLTREEAALYTPKNPAKLDN